MEIDDTSLLEVKETIQQQVQSFIAVLDDLEINDLLKPFFEDLFPRPLRRLLGEYYTPRYLAESIIENIPEDGVIEKTVLDPACGSGVFLMECIRLKIEYLEQKGVKIEVANDPRQGLELIKGKKYDYVLLDYHMPGLYGIDIIQKLEEEKILKDQEIIIFSGADFSSKDFDELLNKDGIKSIMKKPTPLNELFRVIGC